MGEQVAFRARIRPWRAEPPGGLAVIDIPDDRVPELGGRRQVRVQGTVNDAPFAGSTMLVAGGGFAVGISKASMKAAGVALGDDVEVVLRRAGPG
jgi:hypothetical protein